MPLKKLEMKKIYYYIICLMAFFVLLWGAIDFASASINLLVLSPSPSEAALSSSTGSGNGSSFAPANGTMVEDYYQRRMMLDRFGDSLARILISGIIFGYARFKIIKLEGEK